MSSHELEEEEYYTKYNPANDRNVFDALARSPYLAWTNSAACLTAATLAARRVPGLPAPAYAFGFSVAFGLAGYATYLKDYENGGGTATAWTLSWLLLHGAKAVRSRQWQSLAIMGTITANGLIYGRRYFDVL
ncbi:hypothetical protein H4R33_002646 [Dimargaris cristalligena]|uniref:Uncharacterized protein n=1 Tax=Dimargaris cristalligena TaxID=215637 RepID=A0A4P9ZXI8_9FUNG|nr:hypothetical protein H4R33_002646 [Dimargaris cristalligena]RKP38373.1 hypothetical protein BJ085DRAFT_33790 [Dimargaris cristalligena]|eukprot:RKP38373.1 hypothetical protein BJ085DRAFT_33790 [Dimargaris cristalligena]